MNAVFLNFAASMLLQMLQQVLTPQAVEQAKVQAIAWLRKHAKEDTPGTNKDDQLVEILARALSVK